MNRITLPELGENIDAVDVSAVLVSEGDMIQRDQPVIEVETEKASLEVPATYDGRVIELRVKQGDKVSVGQVLLIVEGGPEATAQAPTADPAPLVASPATSQPDSEAEVVVFPAPGGAVRPVIGKTSPAAPSVRALARELGVDLQGVSGSGRGGRISRADVKGHAKRLIQELTASGSVTGPSAAVPPLPDFSRWGAVERRPLSGLRRATARNMATAWSQVPHVTQFDRADVTQLEDMRKRFNKRPEGQGNRLSVTAIATKLCALALKRFPKFNASLDLAGDAVVYKEYVHIGIAVDTPRGLLVPVIRDVDGKRLPGVNAELNDLAARAREKKITPDELRGATFTISNLGGLGTTHFSPIVNWPEVAILGLGRAGIEAVAENGRFEPRLILPLSLSYDHRLIDGADAARFLRWIAEALEQPLMLLLDDGVDS